MEYVYFHQGPIAFRYPRGSFILDKEFSSCEIELSKAQWLVKNDSTITFLGYGQGVGKAWQVLRALQELGRNVNLIDLIFIKPLDEELLKELAKKSKIWFVFSENVKTGGVSSLINDFLQKYDLQVKVISFEYDDKFIEHGKINEVERSLKKDVEALLEQVLNFYY